MGGVGGEGGLWKGSCFVCEGGGGLLVLAWWGWFGGDDEGEKVFVFDGEVGCYGEFCRGRGGEGAIGAGEESRGSEGLAHGENGGWMIGL